MAALRYSFSTEDDLKLICTICKDAFIKEAKRNSGCKHICAQCQESAKKICSSYGIATMKCPKCQEEVHFKGKGIYQLSY